MTAYRPDHKIRSVTNTLLAQASLYGQLAGVEWKEEKIRLMGMVACVLLGFTFLYCLLLTLSALVLVCAWDTQYRIGALVGVVLFHALGAGYAWYRFQALASRSDQAFADTREELAVDIELLRQRLEA